jgi:hypothetical protein
MCSLEHGDAMGDINEVSRQGRRTLASGRCAARHIGALGVLLGSFLSCSRPLLLHAPVVAPTQAREPTAVDLEPIAERTRIAGDYAPPGPAAVLTTAMKAELAGRALRGGEPGGYGVRCGLDRFAVRVHANMGDAEEMVALYADLSCEARRTSDGAVVWRGELRGRACAAEPNVFGSDADTTRRLADRAVSDAAREMASDLALRALVLAADPSARVFADEAQLRAGAGLDDTPYGPAALEENEAAIEGAMGAAGERDATMRAAAWNVVAMAAGPGERWSAGESLRLDEDPFVRFVQYKALARLGTAKALALLGAAAEKEEHTLLAEFLHDAIAARGIGLARSRR